MHLSVSVINLTPDRWGVWTFNESFSFWCRDDDKKKKKKIPLVSAELKNETSTEFNELPIVLVKSTYNNTLVYLTDHKGIQIL
jgi:hypothetical protein